MRRLLLNLILFLSLTSNAFAVGGQTYQPILGHMSSLSATVTGYGIAQGDGAANSLSNEPIRQQIVAIGGKAYNLRVTYSVAPDNGGGTQTQVWTLRINGADTALSCTASEGTATCVNTTDIVTISTGDRWSVEITPSGTPSVGQVHWAFDFIPDTSNYGVYGARMGALLSKTTTTYYSPFASGLNNTTAETSVSMVVPISGTISRLYFRSNLSPNAACADECSWVGTLYVNGSATGITCPITNAGTNCSDLTHTNALVAGDTLSFVVTIVGTVTQTLAQASIGFIIEPARRGDFIFSAISTNSAANGATNYLPVMASNSNWNATETLVDMESKKIVLRDFYGAIGAVAGAGRSWTYTVRNNTASTAGLLTISGASDLTANLTGQSILVNEGEFINWMSVPSGPPANSLRVKLGIAAFVQPRRIW